MSIKKKLIRFLNKFKIKRPVFIETNQNNRLDGRVALITGGGSGIGLEIAKTFLLSGAKVIIVGRNEKKLKEASELLKQYSKPDFVRYAILDVTDVQSVYLFVNSLFGFFDLNVDILVNNAGVDGRKKFPNVDEEEYDLIMNTNLKGTFFISQAFSKYLIKNKIHGNILNIGSSSCLRPANSPYVLSKWGVRAMTLGFAKSLIKHGIVVNGVAPGPASTLMMTDNINDLSSPHNPSERLVTPKEIADISVVLVSNSSRMIVGDMVYITGGSGLITYDDVDY